MLGLDGAEGQIDPARLNVDGGAISLGHPVGTSGNRIVLHLVNAMKRLGQGSDAEIAEEPVVRPAVVRAA